MEIYVLTSNDNMDTNKVPKLPTVVGTFTNYVEAKTQSDKLIKAKLNAITCGDKNALIRGEVELDCDFGTDDEENTYSGVYDYEDNTQCQLYITKTILGEGVTLSV